MEVFSEDLSPSRLPDEPAFLPLPGAFEDFWPIFGQKQGRVPSPNSCKILMAIPLEKVTFPVKSTSSMGKGCDSGNAVKVLTSCQSACYSSSGLPQS